MREFAKELKEENEALKKNNEGLIAELIWLKGKYNLKSQSSKEGITLPTDEEIDIEATRIRNTVSYTFKDELIEMAKWMRDLIQKQITK